MLSGLRISRGMAAALVVAGLALGACASKDDDEDDLKLDDTPADVLYNQGLSAMNSGKMSEASQKFEDIDRLHPYSEYARKALLMSAYVNYTRGKNEEAITAARRFVTLYPGSPDAPYAMYLIGQSYYRQIPVVERDQEVTAKALAAMDELVQRYPDSDYAAEAKAKAMATRDQLAGKEMEIGRYYLQRDNYIAAINRFRVVVTVYQTTRHVEEALARLTEAYYRLGVIPEAQTAAAVLGHNFPDSPWYKDAYSLLQKGGYEPKQTESSWIAQSFKNFKLM